jgi:RNA polymerase sigma factor (sigma-70 family)
MWGWLAQIARGCLIDLARKQRRYAELLERFTDEPTTAAFEGSDSLVSESQLAEGLSRLQPEDRTLLEARYTAEEPIAKIAATLGTTPKAVESRLARIRQRLRIWLTRTDHDEA